MNAVCEQCNSLRPRCESVRVLVPGSKRKYRPQVLCEGCRRALPAAAQARRRAAANKSETVVGSIANVEPAPN